MDVTLQQQLRLRGIMVGYNGPNADGTATLNLPGAQYQFGEQAPFTSGLSLSGRFQPGTVTAFEDPEYATERGDIWSSLNFILPVDLMCGSEWPSIHLAPRRWP